MARSNLAFADDLEYYIEDPRHHDLPKITCNGIRRHSLTDAEDVAKRASPTSSSSSGVQVNKVDWKRNLPRLFLRNKSESFSANSSPAERKRNGDVPFRPRSLTLVPQDLATHGRINPGFQFANHSVDLGLLGPGIKSRNVSLVEGPMDSVSVAGELEKRHPDKQKVLRKNLTLIFSCIYAVMVVVLGGVLYIAGQKIGKTISEVFNVVMIALGITWLTFLHWDLHRYKRAVIKMMVAQRAESSQPYSDGMSTSTHFVLNQPWLTSSAYFFLRGRHSGSFYLKAGMAVFCFGHLINKGLLLGEQLVYYSNEEKMRNDCASATAIAQHAMKSIYSFYQLFIAFKYSNIIINRYKELARFGLMHCIATCLCFWFNTIVEDALEHYNHQEHKQAEKGSVATDPTVPTSTFAYSIQDIVNFAPSGNSSGEHFNCKADTIFDSANFLAIPYLYPFTIEYNIILSAVWFIVWQNIGEAHSKADPIHFERKASTFGLEEEMIYQSNLVISADCHSANKGLFAGILLLFGTIISVIVFFVAITHSGYQTIGVSMYSIQELVLNVVALVGILLAYLRITKLDINIHPITFLDDVLLFIPLPFFFVNCLLGLIAEISYPDGHDRGMRIAINVLVVLQVVIQTPCIMDGLRRCSNNSVLQYQKPGREIVTFLIILNVCMWIVNTFEQKNVEPFLGQTTYYGPLYSVFIGHATLPLMLFYRFHSSVCLADIWKSAYEKGE